MFPKVMMTMQLIFQMDILFRVKQGTINNYIQCKMKDEGQIKHTFKKILFIICERERVCIQEQGEGQTERKKQTSH